MAQKPETLFSNRIRPILEALPDTVVLRIQQVAIRGTPDFILCVRGLFVALELKASERQRPDPLQRHTIGRIQKKGHGIALVVHPQNWPEVLDYLQRLAKGKDDDA